MLSEIGRIVSSLCTAVPAIVAPPIYLRLIGQQMMRIGYFSLPVVGLTAFFTGGVLALQIYIGGNRYRRRGLRAQVVVLGITRELGPVIAGLMVAGRVAAAIAAEIGTMRVTEQIDALTTLSTNPIKYLVVPRLVAAVDLHADPGRRSPTPSASWAAMSSRRQSLRLQRRVYLKNTVDFVTDDDVISGLIKAAVFGFIIALMGCYHGFNSKGGAQGVGAATTNAVVSASILILAANYVLTSVSSSHGDGDDARRRSNSAASRSASARRSCSTASISTIEARRVARRSSAARAPASR